ncbi:hypothetical protein JTE90_029020 [Oedothorax gibbosus]|uniref:Uncharacterized protein n=1 Tax=Oedothorax gibbosus TaxID=931172 RepID=A0AAV6TDZ3_9ARAC|nr:hypothetical protein JTE90_029020 [Oedothorax gibbosus]
MVASHHWPLAQRAHEPSVRTCGSSRTEQVYYRNDESSVEAVHLGDLLADNGYGPARDKYTISLGFSRGQQQGAPDTAEEAVLLREQSPYPGRPIPGTRTLTKKKITLHRVLRRRLRVSVALPHLVRRNYLQVRVGNINTDSLSVVQAEDKHEACVCVSPPGRRLASERSSSDPLDRPTPCFNLLFNGTPSPVFSSFQGSHLSICYYHQEFGPPVAAPGGHHAGNFNARHRDPPTHCGENSTREALPSSGPVGIGPTAGALIISAASCFGR